MKAGLYVATLTVKDANGVPSVDTVNVNVRQIESEPANVQSVPDTHDPETNRLNLQAALERAALNPQTNEILLPAGFIANDPIILPARSKAFGTYVTVRAADLSTLPSLKRVTSDDRNKLFKINARPASVTGYNQAILIRTTSNYFRFVGMEINRTGATNTYKNDIIAVDVDASETRPSHLIFDRILIDAKANHTVRAFAPNSEVTSLLNSSILNVRSTGVETKAVGQWSGNGPLAIVNNRLEAAAINFLVGGAYVNYESEILDGLVFRGNYSWKNPQWVGPNGESLGSVIKNLWELKCGHNIVAAGNIFENNYADGQSGEAILIKSGAQPEEANPRAEVSDVDFRNNKILNTRAGFNVVGIQSWIAPHPPLANHIRFSNNFWQEREGRGNLVLSPNYFELNHNTFISTGEMGTFLMTEQAGTMPDYKAPGLKLLNNLSHSVIYNSIHSPVGPGTTALNYAFWGWEARANVFTWARADWYSAGNFFPTAYESIFASYATGNYSLASRSIYRGAATDGLDIGADMEALNASTLSATSGIWNPIAAEPPAPPTILTPKSLKRKPFVLL
jgi:hypothetical protein